MSEIKFFISPMSENIIDSIVRFNSKANIFGLIPTRRQVDYNGGYVKTGLNTEELRLRYGQDTCIMRDHGGPNQGSALDDGFYSLTVDSNWLHGIHIDPFVKHPTVLEGLDYTVKAIKLIHSINSSVFVEVLTEQAIRYFSIDQMKYFLEELKIRLTPSEFAMIEYCVIQSGVSIDLVDQINTGKFSSSRLAHMTSICKSFGLKSKEHNGDYLSFGDIKFRFDNGLDSLNIGPEIAQIETTTVLNELNELDINKWYELCVKSNKWKRWQTDNFNIDDKHQVIKVCGHYTKDKLDLPNLDKKVSRAITTKLEELYEASR